MSYHLAHFLLEQKNFPMDIVLIIFEIAEKDRLQLKEQKPYWDDNNWNCGNPIYVHDYDRSIPWNSYLECLKYPYVSNKAELAEALFGHSSLPKKNKKQEMWKKKEKLSKSENRGLKR